MIVYKQWRWRMPHFRISGDYWNYEGWFLLGVFPLYVRRIGRK